MQNLFKYSIALFFLTFCTFANANPTTEMKITLENATKKDILIELIKNGPDSGSQWVHPGTFPLLNGTPMNLARTPIQYGTRGRGLIRLYEADNRNIACQFDVYDDFYRNEDTPVFPPEIGDIASNCSTHGYTVRKLVADKFKLEILVKKFF